MSKTHRKSSRRPQADLAPEELLARSSLPRRLAITALVAVSAVPFLPPLAIGAWVTVYALITAAEQWIVARRGYLGGDAAGLAITFALASASAAAAAALIEFGEGGGRFFAVALICFSTVSVLLRYYASPTRFLAAVSPHAAVLVWTCWGIFERHVTAGAYLLAVSPVAVLAVFALLLLPTRARLAEAWRRLVDAKAAAEQASRAKSEFLATMSHEIRTPLNGILGMAQAMQSDDLSPAQKERLRVIRRSGESLLSILNDVLDLSKIEEGQLGIEAEDFDMEHVTRGAVATFTPLAAKKGLRFEFSIDEAAKGTFRGDCVRLRQILYNLVSNAVKFTEAGGVGICISYAEGDLTLEVADSGAGIAADQVDRLFEKFVQGDASATRRHGGTGLGLAICRQLSELMGGRIRVSSVPGRGSLFTVVLPMARVAAAQPAALDEVQAPLEAKAQPQVRILAAEDNETNQLVLSTLLSQAGLEPTLVGNGRLAVEAWETGAWDVILMDIQMPVMDGVAAARAIRAAEAATGRPRTPIIAVTANAMTHQVGVYEAAGIDAVAPKPIDARKLFETIERALTPANTSRAAAA